MKIKKYILSEKYIPLSVVSKTWKEYGYSLPWRNKNEL